MIEWMANDAELKEHVYIAGHAKKRDGADSDAPGKSLIILITGDRGLCGGYNANAQKEANALAGKLADTQLIAIGSKGRDFFRRRKRDIVKDFRGLSENPLFHNAEVIGRYVLEMYNERMVDEVYLVYTEYESMIAQSPKTIRLLPVDVATDTPGNSSAILYDSSREESFSYAVEAYIYSTMFGAMLESAVSEQCARIMGMDSAVKNSEKIIDSLTLQYNQMRQGAITQEIAEIVGGANAVS
jgi:F-type H+-transporting ATPase subunit gamma